MKTGLQSSMMLLWSFAGIPLGVYTIAQDLNVALQIQPQLLTFLSLVTWGQCLYYKKVRLQPLETRVCAVLKDRSGGHCRKSCMSYWPWGRFWPGWRSP